ncbi:unnamed protein product [Mytilus coruscus]|uniref:TIR domain-containing protein n=1 Tax=Mytilus coruscus TaxID=42192 RepID=A0A6J8AV56_MYTCO|nr:unnamed protein product [Mytilus coruscus]
MYKDETDPKCLLCAKEEENIEHFILKCESLRIVRNAILQEITTTLNAMGIQFDELSTNEKLQHILDLTPIAKAKKLSPVSVVQIERLTRRLLYQLHIALSTKSLKDADSTLTQKDDEMNVTSVYGAEFNNNKGVSNEHQSFNLHEGVTVGIKGANCNTHEKANTNDRPIVIHTVAVVIGNENIVTNTDSDPDIVILAHKVDECTVKVLKENIFEFFNGKNNIQIADFIIEEGVDQNFLDAVNRDMHTSKKVFLLLSKDFVTKTRPYISKMSSLKDLLYSNTSSVIPMYLEESISLPMGLMSAYCLHFYKRDPDYTRALEKLLEDVFEA